MMHVQLPVRSPAVLTVLRFNFIPMGTGLAMSCISIVVCPRLFSGSGLAVQSHCLAIYFTPFLRVDS